MIRTLVVASIALLLSAGAALAGNARASGQPVSPTLPQALLVAAVGSADASPASRAVMIDGARSPQSDAALLAFIALLRVQAEARGR